LVVVAVNETLPPAQILVALAATLTVGVTIAVTTVVKAFEVAVSGVLQPAFEVITTRTTSALFKVVVLKLGESVPAFVPFTFHWYEGAVPPFVGTAVNVTLVPAHIVPALDAMLTVGAIAAFTVICTAFELALAEVKQAAFEVKRTVTISLFNKLVVVKVALFVPADKPFTAHWYTGVVPPLVGVAVKVTLVPAQIVVLLAAMLTVGVPAAFTVIVTLLDVAAAAVAQFAFEVKTQETMSPFAKVLDANAALFAPTTSAPLMRH
jgi:hypothetical protein